MENLLAEIDDAISKYDAKYIGTYWDMFMNGNVRVYESSGQRFLVEIRDGRWTVFSFHSNGVKS